MSISILYKRTNIILRLSILCLLGLQSCSKNDTAPTEVGSNGSGTNQPPDPPTLYSPSNGSTGSVTDPTLSWNASNRADSYRLEVSSSSDFSSLTVDRSGITGTSITIQGLNNSTTYYWQVDATNSFGTSSFSSSRSFTTVAAPPTVTTPSTFFIASQDHSVSNYGAWWVNGFTLSSTTTLVLRFASKYVAQAAVFSSDQLNNFENMSAFTGYGVFNNQIGTQYITLLPGSYYVGARNTSSSDNSWSLELDYSITLPASDRCTYYDVYIKGTQSYSNGGKIWNEFIVQSGFRYFLDGCNIGFNTYIIPADQLSAFQNGQTFNSYTDYSESGGEAPGFYEVKLAPGDYYFVGSGSGPCAITYVMERWKVN